MTARSNFGLTTLLFALCAIALPAQTLARPGWRGSGLASEPWWRNAIFYRIATLSFQDSDGDGFGDITGIAQRLDYLQSLGIDAIILNPTDEEAAFNTLLRETTARHIRIVIELGSGLVNLDATARFWLTRGAAGISVASPYRTPADEAAAHLRALRILIDSFPGQRVLIARPYSHGQVTTGDTAQLVGQVIELPRSLLVGPFHNTVWEAPRAPLPRGSVPLLQSSDVIADMFADGTPRGLGLQKIIAAKLLASPGAASFQWAQELGLQRPPGDVVKMVMQWTPTNITPPKPEPAPEAGGANQSPPDPNVYGAYKPYVRPKSAPNPLPPDARPDPNSLPGFSSVKSFADPSPNAATANVAVENADPNSLLNFYRRIIQLHHGNASLRSSRMHVLDHDNEDALVWLSRAPAHANTVATVIVACNLSHRPLSLSLDSDLARLHIRSGTLRPLLASWSATPIIQRTEHIVLPPYSVYIGELYR